MRADFWRWTLLVVCASAAGWLATSSCGYDFTPGVPGYDVGGSDPALDSGAVDLEPDGGIADGGTLPEIDAGVCQPIPSCDDQNPCTRDICANAACTHEALTSGTCSVGRKTGCCRAGACCLHPLCGC